jgi:hypothetical protein
VVSIQSDGTFRLNSNISVITTTMFPTPNDCTPSVGLLYRSTLTELLGPPRAPNEPLEQKHKDLARSVQVTYEVAFLALLQALHKMHPSDNLALAGGCAMNSVANGKVYRRTPFKKMYLPAAAGDAGGAIGAAAFVQAQLGKGAGDGSSKIEDRSPELRAWSTEKESGTELRSADLPASPTAPEVSDQMSDVRSQTEAEKAEKLTAENLKNGNPKF